MGWKLKALAVLVGLMLIPLGAWLFSGVLFLYAASGLIVRSLRSPRRGSPVATGVSAAQALPPVRFKGRLGHPVRRAMGVFFLLLSAVAVREGGTFSPFVLGGIGLLLLLWGAAPLRIGGLGSLRAVEESILLRRSLDPIHWFAIAEVKLATRQAGKALGGIDETLLLKMTKDGPSVFVVLEATSLSLRGAEESLLARFGELARISAPLGAYLMPVDSGRAVGLLRLSVKPVKLESRGWPSSLFTTDYDFLTLEARRGGFVNSVGAYRSLGGRGEEKATLPPARQSLSRPALLWEVFQELGKKVEWQKPDAYTTFLASIFATQGEVFGERVTEAARRGESQSVLVQSLGTPPVQLTRAELRAVARVYA